jgi:hypothetical protein
VIDTIKLVAPEPARTARFSATLPRREEPDVHQEQARHSGQSTYRDRRRRRGWDPDRERANVLMRILLAVAGSLITLAGVVFTLQGVGVIGGSFMSGTTTWAVVGPVIALAGLALVALALRRAR